MLDVSLIKIHIEETGFSMNREFMLSAGEMAKA
jgi:hypothetical protein